MNEENILNIIDSKNIPEILGKIKKFYPTGFDMNKIEPRIREKMKELEAKFHKYNSSEILDEPRKNK